MSLQSLTKPPLIIAAILGSTALLLNLCGFTSPQVLSTVIFLMIICGTLFYWKFRLAFAFAGLFVLLASKLIDIPHVIEFAGLDIILFLVGMMCVIGFLEENQFFEYLVAKVVDAIGEHPHWLMATLMLMATFFAALVDEVTSILFMMATILHITKRYKVNPVPFVLMIVFATNIGSSATAVGNPIGVMIALRAQLSFADFLRWAAPISFLCTLVTILICFVLFRKPLAELKQKMRDPGGLHELDQVTYDLKNIFISWGLFLSTIISLVLHHHLEEMLHLEKNTLLIGSALLFGSVAIFLKADNARHFFMARVDWWTLSFFMVLFASVGTLKYCGVTEQIAKGMSLVANGGHYLLLGIFTAAICLLTAFMDNVLAVATFIPILGDIEKTTNVYIFPFWWAMLFGGTLYGNATIIGSTANIVAMGILEKEYGEPVKFMAWLKPGVIVSTVTILIAMGIIFAQFHLMPGAPEHF